jgi:hypothetical protein
MVVILNCSFSFWYLKKKPGTVNTNADDKGFAIHMSKYRGGRIDENNYINSGGNFIHWVRYGFPLQRDAGRR